MALFKCKMCGGTLEINNGESVATCEYCGTKQTLPKLDDKKFSLYDRANHFRRNNEFDKAMGIYEQILNEDNTDAEAYWSLVLCRYGIEYVEDPSSHKRIPTVNRAQFTSVFDDENYKLALQYADHYQKVIYQEEAKQINETQKGILAISQKEDPFDIFICYKETDANGRRTPDSVLATELYHELNREGYKVFFSRFTLEDKLGQEYEPYIFAALNSAKVMVVLGTKPEYFNAVWVKNEWSRYLALIKHGAQKMLIPAYKDMDPYDLPEEFSHLQAQDMSKLGFVQDLVRGIQKVTKVEAPKHAVVKESVMVQANAAPLLRRAFMFLEDGEWTSADEYCEKVLDFDPENALGYLGKLMAELHIKTQDGLTACDQPFDQSGNYQKAVRFADDKLKAALTGYIKHINIRNENARLDDIYNRAKNTMLVANTESAYKEAAHLFETVSEYMDSAVLAQECYDKAEIARKDSVLSYAKSKMHGDRIDRFEAAIKLFETISGWRDADEQISVCGQKISELNARAEAQHLAEERIALEKRKAAEKAKKRRKKAITVGVSAICAFVALVVVLITIIIPNYRYNTAITSLDAGNYVEAYEILRALDGYKDSSEKANSIYDKYKKDKLKSAQVDDSIIFGSYEQDKNEENGTEDIEWLVLEVKDNRMFVISKYALDCQAYHSIEENITWEKCSLRKWLNQTFVNDAFSKQEQKLIQAVKVTADKNPNYSTDPGADTKDQLFLLSIAEVNQYFQSNIERNCAATKFAVKKGAPHYSIANPDGDTWWWLRSPGNERIRATTVYYDGEVYEYGSIVSSVRLGIRPAMWIDLSLVA